jgi:hypothetical protein
MYFKSERTHSKGKKVAYLLSALLNTWLFALVVPNGIFYVPASAGRCLAEDTL